MQQSIADRALDRVVTWIDSFKTVLR